MTPTELFESDGALVVDWKSAAARAGYLWDPRPDAWYQPAWAV